MHAAVRVQPPAPTMTSLSSPTAEQLVKEIGIPPCPAVLTDFMAESNKDEPDLRRLSHLVNKDVALAAAVLKTVNSPLYGLSRKVRTVQDALALLGIREAGRLIAGFLLRHAFATFNSPAMYAYWDASSRIALVSAYLARELGAAKLEEAHTFALFRDCGIPVLLARFPEYEQLLASTPGGNERQRMERERLEFGYDHALVGSTLAQTWHMPAPIWNAIRVHPNYCEPGFLGGSGEDPHEVWIALSLLAEELYRIQRGQYDAEAWAAEDAFITAVLGPVSDRLEPLANDIAQLMEQK